MYYNKHKLRADYMCIVGHTCYVLVNYMDGQYINIFQIVSGIMELFELKKKEIKVKSGNRWSFNLF